MAFSISWCNKRLRYKGVCSLYPLYSYYDDSAEGAMEGIMALVDGLDEDSMDTDVDFISGFEDTDVTNVNWPPLPVKPG